MNIKLITAFVIIGAIALAVLVGVIKDAIRDYTLRLGCLFTLALAAVVGMAVWAVMTINDYYHYF